MRSRAKERETGKEREGGKRGGRSNKGQEKGTEWRGGGERRAQSGGVCARRMNEIFICDAGDKAALTYPVTWVLSLTFNHSYSCKFASLKLLSLPLPLFQASLIPFLLLFLSRSPFPLLSELSPLVEVRKLFLSICHVLLFLILCLWRKQEIPPK